MPLFLFSNTQTMHNSIAMVSLKKLIPWRDSNPDLLVVRRMRRQSGFRYRTFETV
jgi:hypothetical protein